MSRGGHLHHLLVTRIEECSHSLGAGTWREYPVLIGGRTHYVDLLASWESFKIACEAERSTERIHRDMAKAIALGVDILLIVVPSGAIARAAWKRVHALKGGTSLPKPVIWILPLGAALQRLQNMCDFVSFVNVSRHLITLQAPLPLEQPAVASQKFHEQRSHR